MLMDLIIPVECSPISNHLIFKEVAKLNLKMPQPPIIELEDGRLQENTFHPLYQDAITVYQIQQSQYAFDALLNCAVKFDIRLMKENKEWTNYKKYLQMRKDYLLSNERVAFLKYLVFSDDTKAKKDLTQNVLLHEGQVLDIFNMLTIARDGINIHEAYIKNAVKVDIQIVPLVIEGFQLINPLDEFNACRDNGLDWIKWLRCEYTNEEKASVIALHRLSSIVKSHQEDVVQIESEKKNKTKNR